MTIQIKAFEQCLPAFSVIYFPREKSKFLKALILYFDEASKLGCLGAQLDSTIAWFVGTTGTAGERSPQLSFRLG